MINSWRFDNELFERQYSNLVDKLTLQYSHNTVVYSSYFRLYCILIYIYFRLYFSITGVDIVFNIAVLFYRLLCSSYSSITVQIIYCPFCIAILLYCSNVYSRFTTSFLYPLLQYFCISYFVFFIYCTVIKYCNDCSIIPWAPL